MTRSTPIFIPSGGVASAMTSVGTQRWVLLAKWSATAFIIAGIGRLLNFALANIGEVTAMTSPEWSRDLTLLIAFTAAFVGLYGLYPRVVDQAPRLSKTGAVLAAIAGAAIVLSIVGKYLHGGAEPPGPLKVLPMLYIFGSPLAFLAFGVASWRTSTPSRTVGLLLLVAFAAFLVLVAGILSQVTVLLQLSALLFAAAMLVLGYVLHTSDTPYETVVSGPESAP